MFPVLRSRWSTRRAWQYWSADPSWPSHLHTDDASILVPSVLCFSITSVRVPPGQYSMKMLSVIVAWSRYDALYVTMCVCDSCRMIVT